MEWEVERQEMFEIVRDVPVKRVVVDFVDE